MGDKNNSQDLSRDDVKAQREAKKAAKLAAKNKSKEKSNDVVDSGKSDVSQIQVNEKQVKVDNQSGKEPKPIAKVSTDKTDVKAMSKTETKATDKTETKPTSKTEAKVKVDIKNSVKPNKIDSSKSLVVEASKNDNKENVKSEEESKSKAQLKAERRAKQEQQRAAKAAASGLVLNPKNEAENTKTESTQKPSKNEVVKKKDSTDSTKKKDTDKTKNPKSVHKVKLFNHLYRDNLSFTAPSDVHPAIFRLGVQYKTGVVRGSNARCVALLNALKHMVCDYTTPSEKEYARGFEERLTPALSYLDKCRRDSVSMINAMKYFRHHLTQLPNDITDAEAAIKLKDVINNYIHEQIDMAGKAISNFVQKKITNGDVILTYGCSSLVEQILKQAHKDGTQFRVVIVDGSPWYEGKEMLRRLVKQDIECTYVLLSALSFIMREVSKVIIGAHALLSNGAVVSRAGTAQVALVAQAFNVPVLAACETHKFCEKVQTDAFVINELVNEDELIPDNSPAKNWKSIPYLSPVSLTYDTTPSHLVTAVITELAIVPCTSVPVVLRVRPTETQ